MEKLDCSVLSAVTAACTRQKAGRMEAGLAYRIVALLHDGKAVIRAANYNWEHAPKAQLPRRDHEHEGMVLRSCEQSCSCACRRDRR